MIRSFGYTTGETNTERQADSMGERQGNDTELITSQFFRLLPIQILLVAVSAVNEIVSGLFGSNFIGSGVMSAIGLFGPVAMFYRSVSLMFMNGSQILCGKYIGGNQAEQTRNIFSWDLFVSLVFSAFMVIVLLPASLLSWTRILTNDVAVCGILNRYILGQLPGIPAVVLSSQLSGFLSLEKKTRLTTVATAVCAVVNLIMLLILVAWLHLGAFGLALANSLSMWAFLLVEAQYYFRKKSMFRLSLKPSGPSEILNIMKTGYPGAMTNGYQTVRGIIVNSLMVAFVGSAGLSAFAAVNSFLAVFWAIPAGMQAVGRMLISVSVGEEDRRSLIDIMRIGCRKCVLLMGAVSALLILLAVPITTLFYRNPAEPVFQMTVDGFRILPLCMPFSIIPMFFMCYAQASGKQVLLQLLPLLDGVVCVAGFSALLVPVIGMNGVYIANVLNGVVCLLAIAGYAWIVRKKFPRNMEQLMVIPDGFGVSEDQRIDISVRSLAEVTDVSGQVIAFCRQRGIDERRCFCAGLSLEEMAGNVISHGRKKTAPTVDIRVVHKGNDVILRLKDDCRPFNPSDRKDMLDPEDSAKNIGIRLAFGMATDIQYQNILGLNVLTVRI